MLWIFVLSKFHAYVLIRCNRKKQHQAHSVCRYEQKLQLREEERLMREEQEKQEEKEQQEREEELYAEWRGNISVETSGNEALDPEQLQRALEELAGDTLYFAIYVSF